MSMWVSMLRIIIKSKKVSRIDGVGYIMRYRAKSERYKEIERNDKSCSLRRATFSL